MNFGEVLKQLRKEKGLTQEQLAEALTTTKFAIRNYEYNERNPDFEMLSKIADFFDVSADYLLGRSGLRRLNTIQLLSNSSSLNDGIFKLEQEAQENITEFLNKCYLIVERQIRIKYDKRLLSLYTNIARSLMVIDAYVGGFLEDPIIRGGRKFDIDRIIEEMKVIFYENKEDINSYLNEALEIYISNLPEQIESITKRSKKQEV